MIAFGLEMHVFSDWHVNWGGYSKKEYGPKDQLMERALQKRIHMSDMWQAFQPI